MMNCYIYLLWMLRSWWKSREVSKCNCCVCERGKNVCVCVCVCVCERERERNLRRKARRYIRKGGRRQVKTLHTPVITKTLFARPRSSITSE